MLFRVIEVDDGSHWHMMCWPGTVSDDDFGYWLITHYPTVQAQHRFNNGSPYWVLKGDNPKHQTMILLKWADE